MATFKKALEDRRKQLDEAQQHLEELLNSLNVTKEEYESNCTEIENFKRKIALLDFENNKNSKQLQDLQDKKIKTLKDLEKLEEASSLAQNDEEQLDELHSQFVEINQDNLEKENHLNELKMRKIKLNNDLSIAEKQIKIFTEKNACLNVELEKLHKASSDGGDTQELHDEEEFLTKRHELEELFRQLDISNDDLNRKIKLKTGQLEKLKKESAQVLEKISQHMKERALIMDDLMA